VSTIEDEVAASQQDLAWSRDGYSSIADHSDEAGMQSADRGLSRVDVVPSVLHRVEVSEVEGRLSPVVPGR
jgi:hypothetical protein